MTTSVIGCGRWGSFIAWYLHRLGHNVTLYGRPESNRIKQLIKTRSNGLLTLSDDILLTASIENVLTADIIVISVNSQNLRALCAQLAQMKPVNKTFVLCMKGIEIGTNKRLSEIAADALDESNRVAVWLGPGHVQEFLAHTPNCMVIDSLHEDTIALLVEAFSNDLIRFYYGQDLIGNEIGAAAKNVIGIAAGMLDGLNLGTLKGALASRGTHEISRLIDAMGGNPFSAYGLCHLGDYGATVFSPFSNNRRFGEAFVRKEPYNALAEGVYTVRALMGLSEQYHVELPICAAVHEALHGGRDAREVVNDLFARRLKGELSRR